MTKQLLEQQLFSLNVFVRNEYFQKYVELIFENIDTKSEKGKTQGHHIIPKFYYKNTNQRVDNSENNLVNLSWVDHVMAHYYLFKCSIDKDFINKNCLAVKCAYKTFKSNMEEHFLRQELEKLEQYYWEAVETYSHSEEIKQKISNSIKGRISIRKDNQQKYVFPQELPQYLQLGWTIGHNLHSEETKNKLREKALQKIWVHKGTEKLRIDKEDLDYYLNLGFERGQGPRRSPVIRGNICIHKGNCIKYVFEHELQEFLEQGYTLGSGRHPVSSLKGKTLTQEHKNKIGLARKGRVCINKDDTNLYVLPDDVPEYLQQGWTLGTKPYYTYGTSGKIWVSNELETRYIKDSELNEYLEKGYIKGRKRKIV